MQKNGRLFIFKIFKKEGIWFKRTSHFRSHLEKRFFDEQTGTLYLQLVGMIKWSRRSGSKKLDHSSKWIYWSWVSSVLGCVLGRFDQWFQVFNLARALWNKKWHKSILCFL